jgi:hypothetical protein
MNLLVEELRQDVQEGRCVLIVGTGVSTAVVEDTRASWPGLLRNGIEYAHALGRASDDAKATMMAALDAASTGEDYLSAASQLVESFGGTDKGEFRRWLNRSVGQFRAKNLEIPRALDRLNVPIVTTNYDNLLEQVTGLDHVTWQDTSDCQMVLSGRLRSIVHLHGYYSQPETIVLSTEQYENLLRDPQVEAIRNAMAAISSLVYVGFGEGLSDPHFRRLREWMADTFPDQELRHYRLCRESELASLRAEHGDDRIVPLSYGPDYADLVEFLDDLAPAKGDEEPLDGFELLEEQVRETAVLGAHIRGAEKARVSDLLVPPVLLPIPHDQFVAATRQMSGPRPERCDLATEITHERMIIAGEEHTGVTSALLWLGAEISQREPRLTPVIVDYLQVQGPHGIRKQAIKYLRSLGQRYRESDPLPPLLLLLDNVNAVHASRLERLQRELAESQYERVLIGCRSGTETAILDAFGTDTVQPKLRYVGRLGKADVVTLAGLVDPTRARQLSKHAIDVVEAHNLPGTPFTLSMILSAILRGESLMAATSPTSLLDDYVDLLLGRGQQDDSRLGLDARNRSFILACLAELFVKRRAGAVEEKIVVEELDNILDKYGWTGNASGILQDFRARRVLVLRGREVAFTQSSYLHLFAAKRAQDSADFLDLLAEDPLYYAPILAHYAALKRNDSALLVKLAPLLDMFLDLEIERSRLFKLGVEERQELTAEEVDERIRREVQATPHDDDDDDDMSPLGADPDEDVVPFPLNPVDEEPTPARLITTLGLLSNLIRDTEIMNDQRLRRQLLTRILRTWALAVDMIEADPAHEKTTRQTAEELAAQLGLNAKRAQRFVEDIMLVLPASIAMGGITATLSSSKLIRVVEACLDEEEFRNDAALMYLATYFLWDVGEPNWTVALPILHGKHGKVLGVGTVMLRVIYFAYLRRNLTPGDERRAQEFLVQQHLEAMQPHGPEAVARQRARMIEALKRAKLKDSKPDLSVLPSISDALET